MKCLRMVSAQTDSRRPSSTQPPWIYHQNWTSSLEAVDADIWVNGLSLFTGRWSGWSRVPGGAIATHGPAAVSIASDQAIRLYARGTDALMKMFATDPAIGAGGFDLLLQRHLARLTDCW
jgi:hypothetical protein